MKKKHWIVVLTLICVLLGGYLIYDSNFPYASPIEYPHSTEIKELETEKRSYSYCIYMKNSKVYVEKPYFGVYTIDEKVLDLFS